MKHLQKTTLLCALCLFLFIYSCGDDDGGEEVNLENIEFAFNADDPPIDQALITNLSSSGDGNGQIIGGYLSTANLMTIWLGFFQANPQAQQGTTPVSSCGGNASVYTFTETSGTSVVTYALQTCEVDDKYIFQYLISADGSNFETIMYGEQSKSELNVGLLRIFALNPTDTNVSNTPFFEYTWEEKASGVFNYVLNDLDSDTRIEADINADSSGEITFTDDGILSYKATWNSSGTAGTFTNYDSQGNVENSGNWPS